MTRLTTSARLFLPLALGLSLAACSSGGSNSDGGSTCSVSTDCGAGKYCVSSQCEPRLTVGSCAAGAGHTAAEICASGSCLGGSCCATACSGDAECGASTCDPATGACGYAASTATCGPPESCTAGSHTPPSHCDGAGHCSLATASLCQSLDCTGTQCALSCASSADCPDGGYYCGANACKSKAASGGSCGGTLSSAPDESCLSSVCLTHCCSASCPSDGSSCRASACDDTGACVYPGPTAACGAPACVDSATEVPAPTCDSHGNCQPSTTTVPCAPFLCDTTGGGCFTSCVADAGTCAPAGFCQAGACAAKEDAGGGCAPTSTSTADEACQSDACLGGHCCVQSCAIDPVTQCQGLCDANGACNPQVCNGFVCVAGSPTCASACADNSACDSQHICNAGSALCCPAVHTGDVVHVDGVNGNDLTGCCGSAQSPCQTLTQAMELIAASKASGAEIDAVNGDQSLDWAANEVWPVHLGWGVTLKAAGLFFAAPFPGIQGNSTVNNFEVYSYDAVLDTGTVTIEGGVATSGFDNAVHVGFDSTYTAGGAISAVSDNANGALPAVPLRLSFVWLESRPKGVDGASLDVGPGATVTLGPLPVALGNPLGLGTVIGVGKVMAAEQGLSCHGAGATVTDELASAGPVLQTGNIFDADLDVESGCVVTLTQGPVIGPALSGGVCDANQLLEQDGIRVGGGSSVTFGSALLPGTIQCCVNAAVNMNSSDGTGSPTVALDHANVLGSGCAGAYVAEGTFSAASSSFAQNFIGVWADLNAVKVDLSAGNTVTCNNANPIGPTFCGTLGSPSGVGVDLLNTTAGLSVNAQNTTWDQWDATAKQTQLWSCTDDTYGTCTCSGPSCPGGGPTALPDDADAVFLETSTAATPIDSTQGTAAVGGNCP